MAKPAAGEVRIKVLACGVCRTDLHLVDGDLPQARYPVVPGHEIVGLVEAVGPEVQTPRVGDQVGVPWLGGACGTCFYCRHDQENLCDAPMFTGCTRDGGFATHALARAAFCLPLPREHFPDPFAAAPLLCAGLIGGRSLSMAGDGNRIGMYGFGAAAHLVTQIAVGQGRQVFAFTREGDLAAQAFARGLGAAWAGSSAMSAPAELDAAIIFAPAGELVPHALQAVRKGGTVVCGGIHMSDIPSFPYRVLWGERRLCSVANLTRQDGHDFLANAVKYGVRAAVHIYALPDAQIALDDLRRGRFQGAAVLAPESA